MSLPNRSSKLSDLIVSGYNQKGFGIVLPIHDTYIFTFRWIYEMINTRLYPEKQKPRIFVLISLLVIVYSLCSSLFH